MALQSGALNEAVNCALVILMLANPSLRAANGAHAVCWKEGKYSSEHTWQGLWTGDTLKKSHDTEGSFSGVYMLFY